MIHFLDSSAVVKLYSDEDDHEVVRGLERPLLVSELTRVEVPAALWRKCRMGELDDADVVVLTSAFAVDWYLPSGEARFVIVRSTPALLDDAARLTGAHGLRAFDAVQLAAAVAARRVVPECSSFTGYDRALNRAAATLSFTIRDPTT